MIGLCAHAALAAFAATPRAEGAGGARAGGRRPPGAPPEGAQQARIVDVRQVNPAGLAQVVLRAEGAGERATVDIYVGPNEGAAIARALSGERAPRPMTHDLFAAVLSRLEARIVRLTIMSLREGVFIGELVIEAGGREHVIDTRPSDGMALAAAAGAPVYVASHVLEQAGRRETEEEDDEPLEDLPRGPRPFGPPRGLI